MEICADRSTTGVSAEMPGGRGSPSAATANGSMSNGSGIHVVPSNALTLVSRIGGAIGSSVEYVNTTLSFDWSRSAWRSRNGLTTVMSSGWPSGCWARWATGGRSSGRPTPSTSATTPATIEKAAARRTRTAR